MRWIATRIQRSIGRHTFGPAAYATGPHPVALVVVAVVAVVVVVVVVVVVPSCCSTRYDLILPGFTGFYLVLPSSTGFSLGLT